MSRRPDYETTSYTAHDHETRHETMPQRADGGIGRPRGAAARVAAQRGGPDAATRQARADLEQISEAEELRMRLRMLELGAR